MEQLPYNRQLANEIGVDYANDGKSIRYDPIRVNVDSWTMNFNKMHCEFSLECNHQCERCSENDGFDEEVISIETHKSVYEFRRVKGHQLGHIWSNWYDNSPK